MRIVVDVCETCGYFDGGSGGGGSGGSGSGAVVAASADAERCYSLLGGFLRALLERVQRFKDELLAAAMQLLLRAPRRFVGGEAMRMARVARHALQMGHAFKPLATAALDALERWLAHAELYAALRPRLPELLPTLHAYLALSAKASDRAGAARADRAAGQVTKVARRGNRRVWASAERARRTEDEELQQRIVLLLGRVGGDSLALLEGTAAAQLAQGRWDREDRVGASAAREPGGGRECVPGLGAASRGRAGDNVDAASR